VNEKILSVSAILYLFKYKGFVFKNVSRCPPCETVSEKILSFLVHPQTYGKLLMVVAVTLHHMGKIPRIYGKNFATKSFENSLRYLLTTL
jgi:hypothetical protein